jgi:preprotein translocase subunit SecA
MDVVVIPTNKPMIRVDHPDVVYKTERGKFRAVVDEIEECYKRGQPVLVGTISIEKSERLSALLKTRGIPHQVLNAKHHEREAEIVKLAGQEGAVTIATNMAGRGTDIVLGEGVAAKGGLHIIGTERHESRRIDNQLRGRAGRQGDPGSSRFYVSLEDDLMRLFGSERIVGLMEKFGWEEDQPIESGQITRAIESAQKKVESRNFELRKQVLEYDDVMNQQREVIYSQRRRILTEGDLRPYIREMAGDLVDLLVESFADEKVHPEEWDLQGLADRFNDVFGIIIRLAPDVLEGKTGSEMKALLTEMAHLALAKREEQVGPEEMRQLERLVLLRVIDGKWMDHLRDMDEVRTGIGLRAYGQRDPLLEYKFEAFELFQAMVNSIREDSLRFLLRVRLVRPEEAARQRQMVTNREPGGGHQPRRVANKVGRNDPCPCGSGKKYKKCCGR